MLEVRREPDRALLVQMEEKGPHQGEAARALARELAHLASTAGLKVEATRILSFAKPTPGLFLGKGRVEELAAARETLEAEVVVWGNPLSPVQQRNLEVALKAKVVDRTGLILEIFAGRARTREGRLQVELASLLYQQSRLVRSWTHLERQRGGVGLRGGPGETQIEVDRRLIREKIQSLKKRLAKVERTRALQRREREKIPLFTAALVGYTNAGKSTLFNRLTRAEVLAEDQLFATLDPTMRAIELPGGVKAILSDTVGFIRDLPTQLVDAFKATLEEVHAADLLLLVVDASDPEREEQAAAVAEVLHALGAHKKPMLTLMNKMDRVAGDDGGMQRINGRDRTLPLSAVTGEGFDALLLKVEEEISREWPTFDLDLPAQEGALLAQLYREGRVLSREDREALVHLSVQLSRPAASRLEEPLKKFRAAS